jgi:hypothetical protein
LLLAAHEKGHGCVEEGAGEGHYVSAADV